MRLWTISPVYLDAKGLVALWREALLAKHVLNGLTKGYKNHPQLDRFYAHDNPKELINAYLQEVYDEASKRGYKFDKSKIDAFSSQNLSPVQVTSGQIEYEFAFLQDKLRVRDALMYERNLSVNEVGIMSIFKAVNGDVEPWEKIKS
ncbi:pyrimidine dimer DNA glycosylase/endonuclease V [Campylobacter sp. RM16190]|uniref:pyrimidine dimer DNA glycosylase/endonuclease V n=1 Tax=Campylobacter sp. RM16190 TaxID=1705727 RepID=UPI00147649FA|nr:pyrimidine dimer DNA glycosylase/endonuclease V [Campylobacter sp. RM16190]